LNSKNPEEVRKRRAKASTSRLNVYQKMVLVAGILTLFLAIGISPTLAPILAAGGVGAAVLLFFLFKNLKPKKEELQRVDPVETLPPVEEQVPEQPEILLTEEEKASPDSKEVLPEERETAKVQEPPLEEQDETAHEEAVRIQEPVPAQTEPLKDPQEFPGNGPLVHIQERLVMLEEKTINLEEMLLQLEDTVADIQETQLKSEPKIDLQTILTNIEERSGKMI
jgi:hypothetical protein